MILHILSKCQHGEVICIHPVDIVEDLIIGMGLNSLPEKKSQVNLPWITLDRLLHRKTDQAINQGLGGS